MAVHSENERNKAVVDEFYKAGIQGHLTSSRNICIPTLQ